MTNNETVDYLQQQRKLLFKHIHKSAKRRSLFDHTSADFAKGKYPCFLLSSGSLIRVTEQISKNCLHLKQFPVKIRETQTS